MCEFINNWKMLIDIFDKIKDSKIRSIFTKFWEFFLINVESCSLINLENKKIWITNIQKMN
jgi:hypothetical protein